LFNIKREIAFIDRNIDDLETLLVGMRPDVEPILLSNDEPALRQMARAVQGRAGLETIHVIAHGRPGEVSFGAGTVSAGTLDLHSEDLHAIGQALNGGEIGLWCCRAGQGAAGAAFGVALARARPVEVAAASALVGAAKQGGNWALDGYRGEAPLTAAAVDAYAGVLVNDLVATLSSATAIQGAPVSVTVTDAGIAVSSNLAYQWQVSHDSGLSWVNAVGVGANAATYTPTIGDTGANLRVQTIFTDAIEGSWSPEAAFATQVNNEAIDFVNGKVYLLDGTVNGSLSSAISVYNPITNTWTAAGAVDVLARSSLASAVDAQGHIYMIDGLTSGGPTTTMSIYNPVSGKVAAIASDVVARSLAGAALGSNGKIYIIGGKNALGLALNTVSVYDPGTNTVAVVASLSTAVYGAAVVAFGSKIYVFGGSSGPVGTAVNTVQIYNVNTNTWSSGAALGTAVSNATAGVIDGKIVVSGGLNSSGTAISATQIYDPATGSWTTGPSMPTGIASAGQGLISDGTKMFVVGGANLQLSTERFGAGSESATSAEIGIVACYCAGTLIRTEHGEVPVENLSIGDRLATKSGVMRPIKWIGRRSYGGRFLIGQKEILPVCFKAGSLDENVPARDLWLSPHHAMYLNGILIEARDLVNGVNIVQPGDTDMVEYFHIELDSHDVIVAEGALSESFVDDDSRGMFHNACDYAALYPNDAADAARYCAPRLDDGYVVEAVRDRIAARAGLRPLAAGASKLRGFVDVANARLIAGWAQSIEHPEAPVCLDVMADGEAIGQVLANRYRGDLEQAGIGSGRHSFEFRLPFGVASAGRSIEVRRSLDGERLGPAAIFETNGLAAQIRG
jgi:N-acetylneuraminic acid mutarotase